MLSAIDDLPAKVIWARRGLWARFTPEIEPYFARYQARELLQLGRLAALAAALVMFVYLVLDLFMIAPDILPAFLWIRAIFVITPLLLLWAISFTAWGQQHMQPLASAVAMSVGLAVIALICIARLNGTPIEYEGIILTLFYFYGCGGLRLKWALPTGLLIGAVYPIADYYAGLGTHETIVRTLFLATTNAIGLVSASIMELAARRNFAQTVQLQTLAHADPLTGLLNRRALDERLPTVWRHAAREQLPLYIAMVDVDHFKRYNDLYGHASGDTVLRQVSQVLQAHTQRPLDLLARYGGEEFVFIWVGGDTNALKKMLHQVLHDVHTLEQPHAQSPFGRLSLSIGVVCVLPHTHTDSRNSATASTLAALSQADVLLYHAKAQGRNCAVWAPAWSFKTKNPPDTWLAELQQHTLTVPK